jgi:hypothetical protein
VLWQPQPSEPRGRPELHVRLAHLERPALVAPTTPSGRMAHAGSPPQR